MTMQQVQYMILFESSENEGKKCSRIEGRRRRYCALVTMMLEME